MRQKDVRSYLHAGVERVRVPGEEKLRVRTSSSQATAEVVEEGAGQADGLGRGFDGDERADVLEGDEEP